MIRGIAREEPTETEDSFAPRGRGRGGHHHHHQNDLIGAPKVVVANEHELVVVGINAPDRPGLLLDVSKALSRLGMNLRHTEASVVKQRSISIWRCEMVDSDLPDLEEIWSVLNVSLCSHKDLVVLCFFGLSWLLIHPSLSLSLSLSLCLPITGVA